MMDLGKFVERSPNWTVEPLLDHKENSDHEKTDPDREEA